MSKIAITRVIKILITIPLTLKYVTAYQQNLMEVPRTLLPEKIKIKNNLMNLKKIANDFAKIRDIKILKNNPLHLKLCSNLLSNTRGVFVALEGGETKK